MEVVVEEAVLVVMVVVGIVVMHDAELAVTQMERLGSKMDVPGQDCQRIV